MRHFFFFSFLTILFIAINSGCGSGTAQDSIGNENPPPRSMINQEGDNDMPKTNLSDKKTSAATSTAVSVSNPPSTSPPLTSKQLDGANKILSSVSENIVNAMDGKFIFKIHCAVCHGFKGDAKVNGAPDLTKSTISLKESVANINYGRGLMTPYFPILSKEEIVAVARYSETLR